MIIIERKVIAGIPYLEITRADQVSNHYCLAYHGWTNSKDEHVRLGIELANQGLHVFMPDCLHHGERQSPTLPPEAFVEGLAQSLCEFKQFETLIQTRTENPRPIIDVCGISMGGIISAMLLATYPQIHGGGLLMGTPKLRDFFLYILKTHKPDVGNPEAYLDSSDFPTNFFDADLSLHLANLAGKPLYIWHAEDDPLVPFNLTKAFVDQLQASSLAVTLDTHFDARGGHQVPFARERDLAKFLARNTQTS